MILSGETIRNRDIITPHHPRSEVYHKNLKTTYGESLAGYDLRIEQSVWMFGGRRFVLASVSEAMSLPKDVVGMVCDKSSWARRGVAVQNTVVEPGWRGHLTLELNYHRILPIHIPAGVGICQIVFYEVDQVTSGYDGKYQNQGRGPQKAR